MTVSLTWVEVIALAPELASVSVAGQNEIITQVQTEISESTWGGAAQAKSGALWLARHLGTMANARGQGNLQSVTVGQVSKTFAAAMSKEALDANPYGQEYLRLARKWLPRFFVT